MNNFVFKKKARGNIPLIIGLSGGTGSGKTYSAMELATGLIAGTGKRMAVIDTETQRALHYADDFDFDHGDLAPPFNPKSYEDAIVAAEEAGYGAVIVDSMSHEWAGQGGVLDWQEQELERLVMGPGKGDWNRAAGFNLLSWKEPKREHKSMVQRLLQLRCHLILCFRAEPKVEMAKDDKGKTVVQPKKSLTGLDGWMPICEKNLPFELTMSFMLMSDKPGIGNAIKLERQHRSLIDLSKFLNRDVGKRLGEWAAGKTVNQMLQEDARPPPRRPQTDDEWISAAMKCPDTPKLDKVLIACREAYPDGLPLRIDGAFSNRRDFLIEQEGKELQ